MDLARVHTFLTVIDSGSLLSASEKLDVSRPTLKRRIEELEEQLGTPLIVSTHQGVQPTPAGEKLAVEGRQILLQYQSLMASLSEVGQDPSGKLRIVIPVGIPPWFMPLILNNFKLAHPELSLHLELSDSPLAQLQLGFDIAIVVGKQRIEGNHDVHTLITVREKLIAHRDYLAESGTPQTLEELEGHDLFVWKNPYHEEHDLPLFNGGVARIKPRIASANIDFLRECVGRKLGIALIPFKDLPNPSFDLGEYIDVLPEICGRDHTMEIVIPKVLSHTPRVSAFKQAIIDFMAVAAP